MTWTAPWPFSLRLDRTDTAREEVSDDTGADTNGDVVLGDLLAPLLAVALLRVAAFKEMQERQAMLRLPSLRPSDWWKSLWRLSQLQGKQ